MNELSAALRQFADQIDAGNALPGAEQCALVLADREGVNVQATYIGKHVPASAAGILLLASGIQRFNVNQTVTTPVGVPQAPSIAGDGVIFGDAP